MQTTLKRKVEESDDSDISEATDDFLNISSKGNIDIAIKVLHFLSHDIELFRSKELKDFRKAIFPLLELQSSKHFELDMMMPNNETKLTKQDISITIKLVLYLQNNLNIFNSLDFKSFRRAMHPIALACFPKKKANILDNKEKLSNKISTSLQSKQYPNALIFLYEMINSGDDIPKLGTLQRWVRYCDVKEIYIEGVPSSSTSINDSNSTRNMSLLLLDAVLRVMQLRDNSSIFNYDKYHVPSKASINRYPYFAAPKDKMFSDKGEVKLEDLHFIDSTEFLDKHVQVLSSIPGIERRPSSKFDLNIYSVMPNTIRFDNPIASGFDVPNLISTKALTNVLSIFECKQFIKIAEKIGFSPDSVDGIDNIIWIADSPLLATLYNRVKHLLPNRIQNKCLKGLNARWRFFRYYPGSTYRPHIDGSWVCSGINDKGKLVEDLYGDRISRLTFLVYLNDDFDGGETTFFLPSMSNQVGVIDARSIRPQTGAVLVFPHGDSIGTLVHEGSSVTKGVKYVIRTDVMYEK